MKPTGKSKHAYEAGKRAAREGKTIADNPYIYAHRKFIGLSSWWEAGFNSNQHESKHDKPF